MRTRVLVQWLLRGWLLTAAVSSAAPLTIGAEDDWYPYSALRNGVIEGYAVDLVRATYAAAGVELELVSLPYARCMALVDAGRLAGCFDTPRDRRIEDRYLWHSEPLFTARSQVFARAGGARAVRRVSELEGHRVAITNGYFYGDEFHFNKRIRQEVVNTDLIALRMLAAGRADYALVFEQVARHLLQEHATEFAGAFEAAGQLEEARIYLSFSKTHPQAAEALRQFNRGWAEIRRNGTQARIARHWEGGGPVVPRRD
ncbi:MAG: substrate-binding periplasmic protein [Pseudomonadota bacterium]